LLTICPYSLISAFARYPAPGDSLRSDTPKSDPVGEWYFGQKSSTY